MPESAKTKKDLPKPSKSDPLGLWQYTAAAGGLAALAGAMLGVGKQTLGAYAADPEFTTNERVEVDVPLLPLRGRPAIRALKLLDAPRSRLLPSADSFDKQADEGYITPPSVAADEAMKWSVVPATVLGAGALGLWGGSALGGFLRKRKRDADMRLARQMFEDSLRAEQTAALGIEPQQKHASTPADRYIGALGGVGLVGTGLVALLAHQAVYDRLQERNKNKQRLKALQAQTELDVAKEGPLVDYAPFALPPVETKAAGVFDSVSSGISRGVGAIGGVARTAATSALGLDGDNALKTVSGSNVSDSSFDSARRAAGAAAGKIAQDGQAFDLSKILSGDKLQAAVSGVADGVGEKIPSWLRK